MKLRLGVAMPEKGGRTAIVGTEVRYRQGEGGRREPLFRIGLVDRVTPGTIQGTRDRVAELLNLLIAHQPCAFVDAGTPQGIALRHALRGQVPRSLHRPHTYPRTSRDQTLFAQFLRAYADGRVTFAAGLEHRLDLDRALALYGGGETKRTGAVEINSEDEALVLALTLSMAFPTHGAGDTKLEREVR